MSSTAARILLFRTGTAAPWPVLGRCVLQASSPLTVKLVGSTRKGNVTRRGFGSSMRVLDAGSDKKPVEHETTEGEVPLNGEKLTPGEIDEAVIAEESDEAVVVAEESEGESGSLETSTSFEESDSISASELRVDETMTEESETSSSTPESDSTVASELVEGETVDPGTTLQTEEKKARPSFAFAFDIDGVLLHKSDPIPGAIKTLKFLKQQNIPFILLTNGGGKSEQERVAELSAKLDVPIGISQLVQSHTPFRHMVSPDPKVRVPLDRTRIGGALYRQVRAGGINSFFESTILVLGSDASKARHIAKGYGFKSVVTPGDILKENPELYPFDPLSEFYNKQEILPLPKPVYNPKNSSLKLKDCLKIDLILVFNDPRDWAVDIQLIVDLLTSHRGYLGTLSEKNGIQKKGTSSWWQTDGQPALVYSNSDLLWSTGYHLPRFGQGAFQAAVQGAFGAVTVSTRNGKRTRPAPVSTIAYGKPSEETYRFAEKSILRRYRGSLRQDRLSNIYMVGDNPASDIQGAVSANARAVRSQSTTEYPPIRWQACLVKTGVWNEDRVPVEALQAKPDTIQDDVLATVKWALEREGWPEKLE